VFEKRFSVFIAELVTAGIALYWHQSVDQNAVG